MRSNDELGKIESVLHSAELTDTARQFPEDVLAAAQAAHRVRTALHHPTDNTQEPWPGMRVRGTPCIG